MNLYVMYFMYVTYILQPLIFTLDKCYVYFAASLQRSQKSLHFWGIWVPG